AYRLTHLQHVIDVGDAVVGDFGDVQQTVTTRQDLDDGAEVQQTLNGALVFLTHFDVGSQFLDAALGFVRTIQIGAGDGDAAVIADVDLATGFFGQCTDGGTTLADHITDFLRIDLDAQHARREV